MTTGAVLFRSAFAGACALVAASCFAWTISSRELVDVQFSSDDSLLILVSAPNATEPGIYQWRRDAHEPTLLCKIASPTSFSFDRKTVIERVVGATTELRLYEPSSCRKVDRIKVNATVLDADVRGARVAVAVRLADRRNELRVYDRHMLRATGEAVLAHAEIGRNVEMGFAPDGRSIVNFDLSDGAAAWRVPSLEPFSLPAWMANDETTFVPGSTWVKRYENDTLSVAHWPSGGAVYTMLAARAVRLRQLSTTGRFAMLHTAEITDASLANPQALDWVDFATQKRVRLATGSVDNAAINAAGNRVAWVLRADPQADLVSLHVARINAARDGIVAHGEK